MSYIARSSIDIAVFFLLLSSSMQNYMVYLSLETISGIEEL